MKAPSFWSRTTAICSRPAPISSGSLTRERCASSTATWMIMRGWCCRNRAEKSRSARLFRRRRRIKARGAEAPRRWTGATQARRRRGARREICAACSPASTRRSPRRTCLRAIRRRRRGWRRSVRIWRLRSLRAEEQWLELAGGGGSAVKEPPSSSRQKSRSAIPSPASGRRENPEINNHGVRGGCL